MSERRMIIVRLRTRLALRLAPWLAVWIVKPTPEQATKAMAAAREHGWLSDEGWSWEK